MILDFIFQLKLMNASLVLLYVLGEFWRVEQNEQEE